MSIKNINGSINVTDYIKINNSNILDIIAPEYDASLMYAIGDLVIYSGKLYMCKIEIPVFEDFNIEHWVQINLFEYIKNILNKHEG